MKVAQLCPTLWDSKDYTVHGILQARILEWISVPFSRGSSQPRDQAQVSRIAGGFFTISATREAQNILLIKILRILYVDRFSIFIIKAEDISKNEIN